jgi:hypothetical protein
VLRKNLGAIVQTTRYNINMEPIKAALAILESVEPQERINLHEAAKKNGVIRVTLVSFLQHNSRVQSHGNFEWT